MEFRVMTQDEAAEIAYTWHYDGQYAFYDMEADQEDLEEFLDPEQRDENVLSVWNNEELIGFYSFSQTDKDTMEVGLGMRPNLTGKGRGQAFVQAGLEFAKRTYSFNCFTLSVATFNRRAIRLYERVGFQRVKTFMQHTNGDTYEFLKMRMNV